MHVRQRLTRHGLGIEDHEIDRVAFVHRHADLAVALEAADTGPVPGARIDHDHRRLGLVHAIVPAIVADPRDPEQRVVGRPLKGACVQQQFVIEIQKRRHALPLMRDHIVGAFTQRVEKQHPAFKGVLDVRHVTSGRCVTGNGCKKLFRGHCRKAQALIHHQLPLDW